jgi:hypothetical protein
MLDVLNSQSGLCIRKDEFFKNQLLVGQRSLAQGETVIILLMAPMKTSARDASLHISPSHKGSMKNAFSFGSLRSVFQRQTRV